MEIQRLIGRALRSVLELDKLGERTIWIDCDVIQADGGTRTASITGAFVALALAVEKARNEKKLKEWPIKEYLAAVSVGIDKTNGAILDLCYVEDAAAEVDLNVVMTEGHQFVELQGTGEEATFSRNQLNQMLELAEKGIDQLIQIQQQVLGNIEDERIHKKDET